MYHCTDCGVNFETPLKCEERDSELVTVCRKYYVCPKCESENIKEVKIRYCKCCGRAMSEKFDDYCSVNCRRQGEKLYENQRKKYIHIKSSPIYETARMLEKYNKEHNTNLSYGQFTATVLPKLMKEEKKNGNKSRTKDKVS